MRGIVKVVTSVANGNLRQKLTVEAKGEVAALGDTINNMTDTLATFAEQVTNVAREVGVEGRLGGQANVPGAAGTWKDLTGNVESPRGQFDDPSAGDRGGGDGGHQGRLDPFYSGGNQRRGRRAERQHQYDDRQSSRDDREQSGAGLAEDERGKIYRHVTRPARSRDSRPHVAVRTRAARRGPAGHYVYDGTRRRGHAVLAVAGWIRRAFKPDGTAHGRRGLVGQCAQGKQRILLANVPKEYANIQSSLGEAVPATIVVLPVLFEGQTKAVIELASLRPFTATHLTFLEQLTQSIGVVLNTIEATMRTENLLQQSQHLTSDLQSQQRELQQTNEELERKAKQLAERNTEVERKNKEVEQARRALEEKAAELALTSKYKSEFLANMSHELRTPLNSILILGQQLGDNAAGNLSVKQVDYAKNIHSAGSDLLNLINDILDLSKIESGTVTVEAEEMSFTALRESIERTFRHIADAKNLPFYLEFDAELPRGFTTDPKRLQQILKNLLSNAFKFTGHGHVRMNVRLADEGWTYDHPVLSRAHKVMALSIADTGIGIAPEKQKLIFEAFQQADAGTSRKYGGTGLGLAISRELATLLGGEIRLASEPRQGSIFTLYLPLVYTGPSSADIRSSDAVQPGPAAALPILPKLSEEKIPDDREQIQPGDVSMLIVEDDPHYARISIGLSTGQRL